MSYKQAPTPVKIAGDGELIFLCPICDDSSGHMHLNPDKGVWHCYRCGEGGRITALMRRTQTEYPYNKESSFYSASDNVTADTLLQLIYGGNNPFALNKKPEKLDYSRLTTNVTLPFKINEKQATAAGLGSASQILYFNQLPAAWWELPQPKVTQETPWLPVIHAVRYLRERGYTKQELYNYHLCATICPTAKAWRNRIVIPAWHPETSLLTDFRARTINAYVKPKYLAPKQGAANAGLIYGVNARVAAKLFDLKTVVLCEGPLDIIAVERAGYCAVSICGKTIDNKAIDRLVYYGVEDFILLLDKGETVATTKLAAQIQGLGYKVNAAYLHTAKDPGEASTAEIKNVVASAKALTIFDFIF